MPPRWPAGDHSGVTTASRAAPSAPAAPVVPVVSPAAVSPSAGAPVRPCPPDVALAGRVRRLLGTPVRGGPPDGASAPTTELRAALARHDAPTAVRVRGAAGSGRHALAAVLAARAGVAVEVEDVDELAVSPAPGTAPDVELLTLCTAPCAHEQRWAARPRLHPLAVVATRLRPGYPQPDWAEGLTACAPEVAGDPGTDAVCGWVAGAVAAVPRLRAERLTTELRRLAARGDELAEAALCGRTPGPAA